MRRLTDNQVACLFYLWNGGHWQVYGRLTANSLRHRRLIEVSGPHITITERGHEELRRHLRCECNSQSCARCEYKKQHKKELEVTL